MPELTCTTCGANFRAGPLDAGDLDDHTHPDTGEGTCLDCMPDEK